MKISFFLGLIVSLSMTCISQSDEYKAAVKKCRKDNFNLKNNFIEVEHNTQKCLEGIKAPNFSCTTLDGETIELDMLRGKVVVINFWFISCPPCIAEIPILNEITEKYKEQEVEFIGISKDDKEDLEKEFLTRYDFKFRIVPNGKNIFRNIFLSKGGYPTTIVIDKEGIIRLYTMGGKKGSELKKLLTSTINKFLK